VLQFQLNNFFLYPYLLSRSRSVFVDTTIYISFTLFDRIRSMNNAELQKSEDVKAICSCRSACRKNHELFVRNNICLRDLHSKFIFFLQAKN